MMMIMILDKFVIHNFSVMRSVGCDETKECWYMVYIGNHFAVLVHILTASNLLVGIFGWSSCTTASRGHN